MTRTDRLISKSFVLALGAGLLLAAPAARADDAASPTPAPSPEATPAPAGDATATPAPGTDASAAPAGPKAGKTDFIDNTPIGPSGPHKEAHITILRKDRAEGKSEVSVLLPVQVNGKFVNQFGVGLEFAHHLRETFALTLGGTYFYWNAQNSFTDEELLKKARQVPTASEALLMQWEAHGGFELQPLYGKFAVFNSGVVQFGFYLGTGAGVTQTRVEIQPADDASGRARTFGSTGFRPMGYFNAGFRMFFNEHVALRLEVRDYIYSSSITQINGCSFADLSVLKNSPNGMVSPSCNAKAFYDPKTDANIAAQQVQDPSSEVLNNLMVTAAFSVLF